MQRAFTLLITLMAVASCVRRDAPVVNPVTPTEVFNDPDWLTLTIPTGQEAYAISGDIDKTLLVTTWTKAYYTTDQGKTWQESKNFNGPIPGLLVRNDTSFALQARRFDNKGTLLGAVNPSYFTPDYGKTWGHYSQVYKNYLEDVKPIGTVQSATGIMYSIQNNTTPISPGSFYINPSTLTKQTALNQQSTVRFPFKHKLVNLYLDTQNRLYVAASGGTYDPEHNSFFCCTDAMPAVVYVSKRPLP